VAESFFPLSGFPAYEDEWRLLGRALRSTGVVQGYLNALEPFADGSGMNTKIKSGAVLVDGFYWQTDAQVTVAVGAAHATLPRIDTVVVRLNRTVTPRTYTLAVVAGTPNASPAAPALTQTATLYEFPLADVRVNAAVSAITADKVTDRRAYSTAGALAAGSVGTTELAAGAVTNAKLGSGAVTDGNVASRAIEQDKLAASVFVMTGVFSNTVG
jgi:hypothetical protein